MPDELHPTDFPFAGVLAEHSPDEIVAMMAGEDIEKMDPRRSAAAKKGWLTRKRKGYRSLSDSLAETADVRPGFSGLHQQYRVGDLLLRQSKLTPEKRAAAIKAAQRDRAKNLELKSKGISPKPRSKKGPLLYDAEPSIAEELGRPKNPRRRTPAQVINTGSTSATRGKPKSGARSARSVQRRVKATLTEGQQRSRDNMIEAARRRRRGRG